MEPEQKLIQIFKDIIKEKSLDAGEVLYVMVLVRSLLEDSGVRQEYPNLSFYCDWMLHLKLDRRDAKFFLERIFSSFPKIKTESENRLDRKEFVCKEVSSKLVSSELKEELIRFLKSKGINILTLGDVDNWHAFYAFVLKLVSGNVVEISNIQDLLAEKPGFYEKVLEILGVSKIVKVLFWISLAEDQSAVWNLQLDGTIIYKGIVVNLEKINSESNVNE